MSSTLSFQSGNEVRWLATALLMPSTPLHSIPPTKRQIKSGKYSSSATARLPLLHNSASERSIVALLSDKACGGRCDEKYEMCLHEQRVVGPLTKADAQALATMNDRLKRYVDLHTKSKAVL